MVVSVQEQSLCAGGIIASRNDETEAPFIPAVCSHNFNCEDNPQFKRLGSYGMAERQDATFLDSMVFDVFLKYS